MIDQSDSSSNEIMKEEEGDEGSPPLWRWFCAVIPLALVTLTTGSTNLYPSQFDNIKQALGISTGLTTFMLTGGVMIMYITLPAGLLMDRFGTEVTLLGSVILTLVSYLILPFTYKIPGVFILFYLLMAFGSSSLFIVVLEVVLSRAPPKIKGFSGSIVSATLSFSFGLFLIIYKEGDKALPCKGYLCVFSSFQLVAIIVMVVVAVCTPVAYYFYRDFKCKHQDSGPKPKNWSIFINFKFYLLLIGMLLCVFDGLMVVSAGALIWPLYGKGYPNGASDWGTPFSAVNCVCTVLLSALLDYLIHRTGWRRPKLWGIYWLILTILPVALGFIFNYTDNEMLFGIFMSLMGIPFGVGLSQIPALTSDYFGFELFGFVFGLVQIGSIISAATVMPIVQVIGKTGIMVTFLCCGALHIVVGLSAIITSPEGTKVNDNKSDDKDSNYIDEKEESTESSSKVKTNASESSS